jgi:bisanhydrobacterioruberin hydratase
MEIKQNKVLFYSSLVLLIVHLCGLIGIFSPYRELFLRATPVNLLLCTFLLLLNQRDRNKGLLLFCLISFFAGYFIEVAGVATQKIFGDYEYGITLGPRLFDVPLVMGLNWLMLVFSAGIICEGLKVHFIVKSLAGSGLLVLLDYFIEPAAERFDFWSFYEGPPLQNYIVWFMASFLLLVLFYRLPFEKRNPFARLLYVVQLVFFILLDIF